jgi:hypothetical protein
MSKQLLMLVGDYAEDYETMAFSVFDRTWLCGACRLPR